MDKCSHEFEAVHHPVIYNDFFRQIFIGLITLSKATQPEMHRETNAKRHRFKVKTVEDETIKAIFKIL